MRLSDKQWEKIKDLIPDGKLSSDGKGRPWENKREVLEGILWIVKTGARWKGLPTISAESNLPPKVSAVGGERSI